MTVGVFSNRSGASARRGPVPITLRSGHRLIERDAHLFIFSSPPGFVLIEHGAGVAGDVSRDDDDPIAFGDRHIARADGN